MRLTTLHSNACLYTQSSIPIFPILYEFLPAMAREVAELIELAPCFAPMVFVDLLAVELVEAAPIVVGVALAVPEKIAAVTVPIAVVPIVAAASTGAVVIFVVVEEQLARRELGDRCECDARYTAQAESPML